MKVEDPALKIEVEKLSKENAELKTQVSVLIFPPTLVYISLAYLSWWSLGEEPFHYVL